jgi:hypothetical protein
VWLVLARGCLLRGKILGRGGIRLHLAGKALGLLVLGGSGRVMRRPAVYVEGLLLQSVGCGGVRGEQRQRSPAGSCCRAGNGPDGGRCRVGRVQVGMVEAVVSQVVPHAVDIGGIGKRRRLGLEHAGGDECREGERGCRACTTIEGHRGTMAVDVLADDGGDGFPL